MKTYTENIRQWAKDRKIIPNSTLEAQNLKLAEEFGELADSFRRNNERIKEVIGNIYENPELIKNLDNLEIK